MRHALFAALLAVTSAASAQQWILPAAGSIQGANGTFFRSDVAIWNFRAEPQRVEMRWLPQGETGVGIPPVEITIQSAIPLARGLGSSSSAIVAGLVAGNALLGDPFDGERLLALATEIEGHPDNVAPALLGGFQVTAETAAGGVARGGVVPPWASPTAVRKTRSCQTELAAAWSAENTAARSRQPIRAVR